ncbi:MAG: dipeptidase, partial [Planctomycetaceae bacterium]
LEAAYGVAHGQLAYYRALVAKGELRHICDSKTLRDHHATWQQADASAKPLGFILSMEGSWPVLTPGQIQEWWDAGLRILGPAHYGPNEYCHGTGCEGGWKTDGPALLSEMERVGMLLDVTHLSDECLDSVFDMFGGRLLASHHNCRQLVPDQRQLTDDQIKKLVDRGAVIGASFDNWMITPNWRSNPDPKTVSLEDLANHTDHICQLAGNANHCGIGSDLDGGFGKEQCPHDIDTIADLARFAEVLANRGYGDDDIRAIMYDNWNNFFLEALPDAR